MILELILIAFGFVLLIGGANALVDGASNVAQRIGMPERVVGLTVVSMGTAMPELMVSITSAMEGHADMAFGNVVGSCMANLLLILGLSATVRHFNITRRTQRLEIPIAVGAVLVVLLFANLGTSLNGIEGGILVLMFIAFIASTVVTGLREGDSGQEDLTPGSPESLDIPGGERARKQQSIARDIVLIVAGAVGLKFGASFVVDNAVLVAGQLGMSERIIGITVIALGTCLPELITSLVAAFRGNTDLAIGNVIGANISNTLLVLGAPALFAPIAYDPAYNVDFALYALASFTLVILTFTGRRHTFTRINGIVFVMGYVFYIVFSMLR